MTQWWMAVSRAWFCAKSTNGEDLSLSLGWQGESFQNIQDFFSDFCFFIFSFFSFCVAFPLTSLFVWRRNWVWNLLPLLGFPFEADRIDDWELRIEIGNWDLRINNWELRIEFGTCCFEADRIYDWELSIEHWELRIEFETCCLFFDFHLKLIELIIENWELRIDNWQLMIEN